MEEIYCRKNNMGVFQFLIFNFNFLDKILSRRKQVTQEEK
jgi:hypothetical protein